MIAGAMFERPSGLSVPGACGAVHLLRVDDLLHDPGAPAAPLLGPGDRGVAGVGEGAVPGAELLEPVAGSISSEPPSPRPRIVVGQVGLEPGPELLAEGLGLGRVAEVHRVLERSANLTPASP